MVRDGPKVTLDSLTDLPAAHSAHACMHPFAQRLHANDGVMSKAESKLQCRVFGYALKSVLIVRLVTEPQYPLIFQRKVAQKCGI